MLLYQYWWFTVYFYFRSKSLHKKTFWESFCVWRLKKETMTKSCDIHGDCGIKCSGCWSPLLRWACLVMGSMDFRWVAVIDELPWAQGWLLCQRQTPLDYRTNCLTGDTLGHSGVFYNTLVYNSLHLHPFSHHPDWFAKVSPLTSSPLLYLYSHLYPYSNPYLYLYPSVWMLNLVSS